VLLIYRYVCDRAEEAEEGERERVTKIERETGRRERERAVRESERRDGTND
jgi:hypothetical protein